MKILAVDDDSFILELLTMICARSGYPDVTTALSGKKALSLLNADEVVFDCLLFDINMPETNGIDLCELVRAIPAYRKTPIIMLTAMTEKHYIDRAFEMGATDYVNKPFDMTELGARLRVAEELMIARREAPAIGASAQLRAPADPAQHAFDLADELCLADIKGVIEYTALGNYLSQLSRAGLAGSQVLAVKINQIDAIYAKASTDEFLYALTEVADAVGDALKTIGCMMAYTGNGVFVIVSSKPTMEPSFELETEIQNLLDEKDSQYDNGDPLDIDVSVGNPLRPNASKAHRVLKTFDRAIARAENRAIKKSTELRSVNLRRVSY